MQKLRYSALSFFLLLSTSSVVSAQVDASSKEVPIQIRLAPDKKTIMLGEPLFIAFEVTNGSAEKLCLGVGGDYRNRFGRPERFKVTVTGDDGVVVPQPEAPSFGGFIGCAPIEAGDTYTVRLFLSHWATIERTGSYRINVKRPMGFTSYVPSASAGLRYSFLADVNSEFSVVAADENKMGDMISRLGSVMLDSTDPRASDSAKALASVQDKRVIGYFAEALRKYRDTEFGFDTNNLSSIKSWAIATLATYDDDGAIEALEAAMSSTSEDTRMSVATAFGDSPHRSATGLLLKMQNDSYWWVRLSVAQGLATVKSKESLAVLRKLLKDENESVRNGAKESLEKISAVRP